MKWRFIEFLYNWHVFIDLFMELESPQLCCDQTSNIIYLFILNGIGTIKSEGDLSFHWTKDYIRMNNDLSLILIKIWNQLLR